MGQHQGAVRRQEERRSRHKRQQEEVAAARRLLYVMAGLASGHPRLARVRGHQLWCDMLNYEVGLGLISIEPHDACAEFLFG
jgi:hypothetical protein